MSRRHKKLLNSSAMWRGFNPHMELRNAVRDGTQQSGMTYFTYSWPLIWNLIGLPAYLGMQNDLRTDH